MRKIHTVITSYTTYLRLLTLFLLSILFVAIVPLFPQIPEIQEFLSRQVVNMGILYAIIVGFLLSITLNRKNLLEEYIYLELNKIRRIYHLSLHLFKQQSGLEVWFGELARALKSYHTLFSLENFSRYEDGDPLFRKVTYAVYQLPSFKISYNSELYQSLLDAASASTEAREYVRATKANSIGLFQWVVLGVITLTLGIALVGSTPTEFTAILASAVFIFNLLLTLDLLYEYDNSNVRKDRFIAELYARNLEKLEIKS